LLTYAVPPGLHPDPDTKTHRVLGFPGSSPERAASVRKKQHKKQMSPDRAAAAGRKRTGIYKNYLFMIKSLFIFKQNSKTQQTNSVTAITVHHEKSKLVFINSLTDVFLRGHLQTKHGNK
jgi:hypothetical protein